MGFEYWYALVHPKALVIWEGQFGDFVNGAQIILDQYLMSAETKWGVASGLVLYLPHGFEGQGPEHSSARIERFLELGADKNVVCAIPTTTAQFYHLLRRHGVSNPKRPLIIFTPKSLLRDERTFSDLEAVEKGAFEPIVEIKAEKGDGSTCIFTFGKIVYDIKQKAAELNAKHLHIFAIEQLYPFDDQELMKRLDLVKNVKKFLFVQDEPKNMGAYPYLRPRIEALLMGRNMTFVGRNESSSPACGSPKISAIELEKILKEIFDER